MFPIHRAGLMTVVGALMLACSGCGSGSGDGSTATNNPLPTTQPALLIDLTTGQTRGVAAVGPVDNTATQLALVQAGTVFVSIGEVTAGQWQTVMGTTPWTGVPSTVAAAPTAQQPAINLSYADAGAFAAKVQEKAGFTSRLPSDAEFAALVGGAYPWGSSTAPADAVGANVRETNIAGGLRTMSEGVAAASGLYHLVGNIREWTRDGHLAGGSWADNLVLCSSTQFSESIPSSTRHPLCGMRLVVEK